jgi:type IV pilus assembly protein PilM
VDSLTIGLDIGSSGVRAAEIHVAKDGRRMLRRYAQVGLPHGYVVDGEIQNVPGVAAALRRLWGEAGFASNKVVLGVSGPRVFIRQADVPALNVDDLRSSLRFDAQELVPIPMEDATFDFGLLGSTPSDSHEGSPTQRILLVAAHRDLLRTYLVTLKEASLEATVMDATPLALMRAVPAIPDEFGRAEVIVSVGAELTTVAVRQDGVPRFIRSLTVGGTKLTESIANSMHLEYAVAERLKRGAIPADIPQLAQARRAVAPDLKDLGEEIRATIEFFLSQSGDVEIGRLLVTGGGSRMDRLPHTIAGNMPAEVLSIDPFAQLDTSATGYGPEQLRAMAVGAAPAVGLALWPTEAPLIRLSLLPEEVLAARRTRRIVTAAGAGVASLTVLLGFAGAVQRLDLASAQTRADREQNDVTALNGQVHTLEAATSVHGRVTARDQLIGTALSGDVDWVRVIGQLAGTIPPNLSLASLSVSRPTSSTGSSSSSGSSGPTGAGSLSMNVKGTGGLPAAAQWLVSVGSDADLTNLAIGAVSVDHNGGNVSFSSTTNLSSTSLSNRSKDFNK